MKSNNVPKVVEDCHQLLKWVIPVLDQLPRKRRYTLGERLEQALLDVLADLVEASFSAQKQKLLNQANRQLSVARHLWRLALELGDLGFKRFEHGARLIDDVGVQIGAWRKSSVT